MNKKILSIKSLSKTFIYNSFGQPVLPVLKDINIDFAENQIIGLLGKNGAGKTTFIKSCIDLLEYKGDILFYGKSLKSIKQKEKVKLFSAVLEGSRNIYWKLTVIENIQYFASLRGISFSKIKDLVGYLLKDLFLYEKRNTLVENLSSGMKQKVALVCAFAMDTPIVFLDEPTLGLDLESKNHVVEFLKNSDFRIGKLIIITSHDLDLINKIASNIILLKGGKLIDNKIEEINEFSYTVGLSNNSDLDLDLISSLRLKKLYGNDRFTTYGMNGNCPSLSNMISALETNSIEIVSIENSKFNLENIYL
ncbi:MAG: ABC transporter ATP-binding protein [Lutibacter sp.]|nr:ABC transporter ATP-binding protein [Lutibacter sp.]